MVSRVFKVLYKEISGLHQAAYILALFTLLSQLLAIVRDRTLAHQFGAGEVLDMYYAAFRIPDILFVLFASVLSVYVLLPYITKAYERSIDEARALLSQLFTLFLICYFFVALLVWLFVPTIVAWLFPQFLTPDAELVTLIRLLLLQPLLLGLSGLCGVVTQLQQRFIIYAVAPLIYNLGIIGGALYFYDWFGLIGLGYGVLIGAAGHLVVQLPLLLQSKLWMYPTFTYSVSELRSIVWVALPRALTLSLSHIQMLLFVVLASMMTVGSISIVQFAFNLQSVPLAIIGASYSVAAFPTLTKLLSLNKLAEFHEHVLTTLRHVIFWSLPAIALIVVLRAHVVRSVLGSGAFDWNATRLTAAVLAVFVITLTMQCFVMVLLRAMYAGGRTLLPLVISGLSVGVGIGTALLWYCALGHYPGLAELFASWLRVSDLKNIVILSIPLGFLVGVIVELLLMLWAVRISTGIRYTTLWRSLFISTTAALGAGLATYATLQFIVEGVNQTRLVGILLQGGVAGMVGMFTYVGLCALLRSDELREVHASIQRRLARRQVAAPHTDLMQSGS